MTLRIGINGFGRIGRNVLRAIIETGRDDVSVVAINDLTDPETNAHLLQFDSVHGRFANAVTLDGDTMDAGTGPIRVTGMRNPADLPWSDVDIVLECTGIFTSAEKVQPHLENGSKRVLISAPAKGGGVKTIVYGVNHDTITGDDVVVSSASCTTNCLAPMAKVLNDTFGIKRAMMTTVHAYTGDQPTHDTAHKDLNRARAAALSMVPTSTGAAEAVGLVLPELSGRLTGQAIRVPTPNVSCVDLISELDRDVTADEVNAALTAAAASGPLHGVLGVETRPTVSVDYNHNPFSSVAALDQTKTLGGNMLRTLSWYDNEWGFSCRMIDTAVEMGKHL